MSHRFKKIGILTVAIALSFASFSSFACSGDKPYRIYYLNKACQYYTTDANGSVVVGGKYNGWKYKHLPLHRDGDGRYYRVDAWGNKMYIMKHCHVVHGVHHHHWKD